VKLYTRTLAGTGLLVPITLTGAQQPPNGSPKAVEVTLPIGCDCIFGDRIEALPKAPSGCQRLWTDPTDLCHDDGRSCSITDVQVAIDDVKTKLRDDMRRGPLGDRWP
jgi:hypothetical protein